MNTATKTRKHERLDWFRAFVLSWLALGGFPISATGADLTFYKDIAPIVWHRCSPCHRPGEIGPFPLLTYDDVRGRAAQIAAVTARRIMPPWKPEPGAGTFQNERRLSDDELLKLQRWIADGAPAGDRSHPTQAPPLWADGWASAHPI